MDLNTFKTLVDARSASSSRGANNNDDALLAQIRACFTLKESDQAQSNIGHSHAFLYCLHVLAAAVRGVYEAE